MINEAPQPKGVPKMQYTTNIKIKLVLKISKAKNKVAECLKLDVAISTYYYWRKKYLRTGSVENKSRKPKNSPRKLRNGKIIKRIKELYLKGRGKYYIQAQLKREGFEVGASSIVGTLKRLKLWRYKKRKTKKRYNGKFVGNIKIPGEIIQIDTKYVKLDIKTVYQFTAVDLATRYVWRRIYEEKTPENAVKFLKYILNTATFKIQAVQTDNGSEFTYRCMITDKESQFDLLCKKLKITRRFIPIATPRYNGVVERVHGTDERELYCMLDTNITLDQLKCIIINYSKHYNNQRLHSSLNYATVKDKFKSLEIPIPICLTP